RTDGFASLIVLIFIVTFIIRRFGGNGFASSNLITPFSGCLGCSCSWLAPGAGRDLAVGVHQPLAFDLGIQWAERKRGWNKLPSTQLVLTERKMLHQGRVALLQLVSNEEGRNAMKHRIITFAFVACLASSMAFADNPTDAALMPIDGSNTVVQQAKKTDRDCKHASKKDGAIAAKTENPSSGGRQAEQANPNDQPAASY